MALALGGIIATGALFKYNRKNFMFDKKMRQEREFQEQDMKVEQFVLYREDVRDLVELTVAKMDLYLIAAALLADRLTVMVCTQNEALPPRSPEWVVALNSMSLASGMFYLLLCLWLAMYASVSAQAYGARLLTQLVRLPYATREQIAHATSQGTEYEERSVAELLRVPIAQRHGPGTTDEPGQPEEQEQADSGAASSSAWPGRSGAASGGEGAAGAGDATGSAVLPCNTADPNAAFANLLPTAMLEHIRLYRRMQLNWLAYDAYARVSLFAGANCCLYCCLYWSLGQFLHKQHAWLPAMGVNGIFSCVQVMLLRLDLRVSRKRLLVLGTIIVAMPVLTSIGMVFHQDLMASSEPMPLTSLAMGLCAFGTHALHSVSVGLLLFAAWPDPGSGAEAFLPGKFRSTLFLDVFGWLLNPGGPGAATPQDDELASNPEDDGPATADAPADPAAPATPAAAAPQTLARAQAELIMTEHEPNPPSFSAPARIVSPAPRGSFSPGPVRRGTGTFSPGPVRRGGVRRATVAGAAGAAGASSDDEVTRTRSTPMTRRGSLHVPGRRPSFDRRPASSSPLMARRATVHHGSEIGRRRSLRRMMDLSPEPPQEESDRVDRRQSVRRLIQQVDFSPDLWSEAARVYNTDRGQARHSPAQEYRFGGREAQPLHVMEIVNEPTQDNTTDFAAVPSPQRVREKAANMPGERPWRSFRTGTLVTLVLWNVCTIWVFTKLVDGRGWYIAPSGDDPGATSIVAVARLAAGQEPPLGPTLLAACSAAARPVAMLTLQLTGAGRAVAAAFAGGSHCPRVLAEGRPSPARTALVDYSCGLRRPIVATAMACHEAGDLSSGGCLVALLRRGGREASLCRVRQGPRGSGLDLKATLRVASGVPPLQHLALGWAHRPAASPPSNRSRNLKDIQVFARTVASSRAADADGAFGSLLALRPLALGRHSGRIRGLLVPEFEVERADERTLAVGRPGGRLAMVGQTLLSLESGGLGGLASRMAYAGSCPANAALAAATVQRPPPSLTAWDLTHGEREELRLAAWDSSCEEPAAALRQLCAAQPGSDRAASPEFLTTQRGVAATG